MNKLLFLCLLFLTACQLQAPYKRPSLNIPNEWRTPTNHASTCFNQNFWLQFQDSVLNCYIREALGNNWDLKIAIHRVCQAIAEWGIVSAKLYPTIDFNLLVQRAQVSATATPLLPGQSRVAWDINPFFSLSYELDLWNRIHSASDAAFEDVLASIEARRTIVLTIVSAVASSYFNLRMLDAQLVIATNTLNSRIESLRLANIRYTAGQISLMEVRQAEAEAQDADASKTQIELKIALQENLLSILLGRNPGPIKRGKTLDELQKAIFVPADMPSSLICARPDVKEAEDKLQAAHFRVAEAKALFFPQINLTATYGAESTELANLFSGASRTWSWGFTLLEPIFNAGKTYYQVERARQIRWESLYNYKSTLQTAFKEVDDALVTENKTRELIGIESARVFSTGDYLRLANLRYDNGETDYLTVLDAERRFFTSELDLAETQGEHLISYIDLFKSLGGAWVNNADCQMLKSQPYDPTFTQNANCYLIDP